MRIEEDNVIFKTGKVRYANKGILGLSPELEVTEGYDGGFYSKSYYEKEEFTKTELIELADYMIEQWKKFRTLQI